MVHEIIRSKLSIFLEALILTLLILIIGFILGYSLENHRTTKILEDYKEFEVSALDLKLQNYYYQIMNSASCEEAIKQNLVFADKIYNNGLILQKYEDAGQLSQNAILTEKKKHVLLETELWLNSILLKEKCANSFHTVVYLYSQNPDSIEDSTQAAISNILEEVKKDFGNKIILIPIAGDIGLDSVDLQRGVYNISSLPSVIIDEKILFEGFTDKSKIEFYLY